MITFEFWDLAHSARGLPRLMSPLRRILAAPLVLKSFYESLLRNTSGVKAIRKLVKFSPAEYICPKQNCRKFTHHHA